MTEQSAVTARAVEFAYGDRTALCGIDFEVARGSVHGFLGPNGSGKSTLFRLLATILPLRRGKVRVLGLDLATEAAALRKKLGVVFQSPALDKKLSVWRNLSYGGQMFGLGGADLTRRVDSMLEYAGLRERAKDRVADLSGGLRRRVEIAKGMLHDPELLLLDEPTTGLDPAARRDMWEFVRSRPGVTVLFTTHLMDEAEQADQLTILDAGKIVAADTPRALRASIGGEVLEIGCADPSALAAAIGAEFGVATRVLDGVVRVEIDEAHGLVPSIMRSSHAASIDRITLSHPSLGDVFLDRTGRSFVGAANDGAAPPAKGRRGRARS